MTNGAIIMIGIIIVAIVLIEVTDYIGLRMRDYWRRTHRAKHIEHGVRD